MIVPIGTTEPISETPWITILIIGLCVAVQLLSPFNRTVEKKLERFCKSPAGEELIDSMSSVKGIPKNILGQVGCEEVIVAILNDQVAPLIEESKYSAEDKEHLKLLVSQSKRGLDLFGYHAFSPRNFSIVALFTSLFCHSGWIHLIGNMFFLWIFGRVLEDLLGPLNYLLLFIGAGVFANLFYATLNWIGLTDAISVLGASAGIYGVMAGIWRKFPSLKVDVVVWALTYFKNFQIKAFYVIGFYVLVDFFSLVGSGGRDATFLAHLAGFFIVFISLEQWKPKQKSMFEV